MVVPRSCSAGRASTCTACALHVQYVCSVCTAYALATASAYAVHMQYASSVCTSSTHAAGVLRLDRTYLVANATKYVLSNHW